MGSEINLVSILKVSTIKLLLQFGANPDSRDRSGLTPLMKAARHPQGYATVKLLIEHKADVNDIASERHDYRTVLHHSIFSGNVDLIRLLLTSGARYPKLDFDKPSPLDIAIISGRHDIVKLLLEFDADVNFGSRTTIGQPLHTALTQRVENKRKIVELLLEFGADPNSLITSNRNTGPPLQDYLHSTRQCGPSVVGPAPMAAQPPPLVARGAAGGDEESPPPTGRPDFVIIRMLLKYGARVVLKTPSQSFHGLVRALERIQEELSLDLLCLLIDAAEDVDWFMMSKVIYATLRQADRQRANELFDPSWSNDMTPERLRKLLADKEAHHKGVPEELIKLMNAGKSSSAVLTLKQISRIKVRKHLSEQCKFKGKKLVSSIEELPLPTILENYLLYQEQFTAN